MRTQIKKCFMAALAVAAVACGAWFIGRSSKPDTRSNGSLTGASTVSTARVSVPTRARNHSDLENGDIKTITLPGGATIEMIYVAPGEFMMGSPESEEGRGGDEKQHHVTLTKGFWLGKYEVTQEQWESVMGNNPSDNKGDDLPVEQVSWEDCQEFIRKVNASLNCGARLPTEAEWEYACRAGASGPYAGGSLDSMGWYDDNSGLSLHPVGQKSPNPWGFYDMHGNVWEWCNDSYGDYPSGSVTDPVGGASGTYRVDRGGGWGDGARGCRSACRDGISPGTRSDNLGFRVALAPSH